MGIIRATGNTEEIELEYRNEPGMNAHTKTEKQEAMEEMLEYIWKSEIRVRKELRDRYKNRTEVETCVELMDEITRYMGEKIGRASCRERV